jgi:hypothetical protein
MKPANRKHVTVFREGAALPSFEKESEGFKVDDFKGPMLHMSSTFKTGEVGKSLMHSYQLAVIEHDNKYLRIKTKMASATMVSVPEIGWVSLATVEREAKNDIDMIVSHWDIQEGIDLRIVGEGPFSELCEDLRAYRMQKQQDRMGPAI